MKIEDGRGEFADLARVMPGLAKWPGLVTFLEKQLGIRAVRRWFLLAAGAENPFAKVAQLARIDLEAEGAEKIPETGATVLVANHPFGGPDALAVAAVALERRSDVLILANDELARLDGVGCYFLAVDLLGKDEGGRKRTNAKAFRELIKHVRGGGCVVIFPAGRVAGWFGDRVQDPPWSSHVTSLLQRLRVPVVPVGVRGPLPRWILILGALGATVRRALIPRGMVSMRGRTVEVQVGEVLPPEKLVGEVTAVTRALRRAVDATLGEDF